MANVLIMGGSLESQEAVRRKLTALGHTCELARDAAGVRLALQKGAYDCALLDDSILDYYGFEVLAKIRKSYRHCDLRLALMTALPEKRALEMRDEHLAVDILLAYPFEPDDAIHAIEIMLSDDVRREPVMMGGMGMWRPRS